MRVIKFRAWVKMNKSMRVCGDERLYGSVTNQFLLQHYPDSLMQYIGLKDKNGAEIYEGDIYRIEIEHDKGDERHYAVCVWLQEISCFGWLMVGDMHNYEDNGFKALNDHGIPWNCDEDHCKKIKIIGNIYERPELLKQ